MIKNWFKIFIHHIKNNKLFTFLNVVGLSIGIAGIIFAILYWNEEHSYNSWNPEKDKVFQTLVDLGNDEIWANNPSPIGPLLMKKSNKIEDYCYLESYYKEGMIEYTTKKILFSKITSAQNNFFSFFPFQKIYGSIEGYKNDKNSIALSQNSSLQIFGKTNPIGKQVKISNVVFTVRFVYSIPGKSSISPEAIVGGIDERIKENKGNNEWGNYNYGLLIKLKKPSDKAKVECEIENLFFENVIKVNAKNEGITVKKYLEIYGRFQIYLEQLKTDRINSRPAGLPEGKGNYQFLLIMMGVSILILILSIVNYVNLATAYAIKRAKEVGVRKIIGASKRNIIFQFVFETVVTTLFAVILALSIVEITLPYYNEFLEKEFQLIGSEFFLQLFFLFIITVLIAGIFPAIYVADFDTLKVVKGNFGRSKSGVWIRNSMLILQFSIAAFFIIGATIVHRQVEFMSNKDLGFNGKQIVEINYPRNENEILYSKYESIKNDLLKIKGVEKVSSGAFTFGNGANSTSSFNYNNVNIQGHNMTVDYDMLEMLEVKLKTGRFLDEKLSSDSTDVILVNETALKMMKEKNPIGKIVDWNENQLRIIGVVKDFHLMGLQNEIPPMVFFHHRTINWGQFNVNRISVKISSINMSKTLSELEKYWKKNIHKDHPFQYNFVDKQFELTYKEYVNQRNLFSILNVVVILIALFGLFALASFSVERRMKEIAIRKTLGAETKSLLFSLSKQYVFFCLIGFCIAVFPVYYLLEIWLQNFAYQIDISIQPFIIGFIVLMILTLTVVLKKAYQATKVNVLKYLKYE